MKDSAQAPSALSTELRRGAGQVQGTRDKPKTQEEWGGVPHKFLDNSKWIRARWYGRQEGGQAGGRKQEGGQAGAVSIHLILYSVAICPNGMVLKSCQVMNGDKEH